MKVRPYERSTLWRAAFSKRKNDPDERDRQALAEAYRQLRERAGDLVGEIHAVLPQLTVHDLTHADTLWDVASEICGPKYALNPLEAFVLGAGFLLHDAGMALAAYPGGLSELKDSPEYHDAIVAAWKKNGVDDPSSEQRSNPEDDIRNEAIFQVLRGRHARQAKELATALWTQPATGHAMALVQNDDLLESYGELIGNISASHHWPITEVARFFGDPTPASAAWPRAWEVDGLSLACILRCADACAIDETRAPSFLFALRKPQGESKRHWTFQNKIYPAKRREDGLMFESKSPFHNNESDDWWLCFDAIAVADQELRSTDAALSDRRRQPLQVRRAVGANSPDILTQTVRVEGWKPVNTQPKISDPQSIIERLGGRQLYGDEPSVPIRELIQNAVDAIRARRFLDPFFCPTESLKYQGSILIQITQIVGSEDYWVSVEDNGIGMSERVITGSLLDFGTSFWSSEVAAQLYPGLPSERTFRPIGKFGIGFFSIFMYSEIAKVISREFRGAKDSWNVLVFEHGARRRGKFSVNRECAEISMPDTSTRISIRVNGNFLKDLTSPMADSLGAPEYLETELTEIIGELVAPLDVSVGFSFMGRAAKPLNDPLLYEKDRKAVWDVLARYRSRVKGGVGFLSPNQEKMLILMGSGSRFFGYCGVNISRDTASVLQSVGGLGSLESSIVEPICGVAEYHPRAASRRPDALAVPADVFEAWITKQIDLIKHLSLSEEDIQGAIQCFVDLKVDVRPIFRVLTNRGPLGLEEFISVLTETKKAIFPVRAYEYGGAKNIYSALPTLYGDGGGLYLKPNQILFSDFTIYSDVIHTWNVDFKRRVNYSPWGVIISALQETNLRYEIVLTENKVIGKYAGLDSPLHHVSRGDEIRGASVEVNLT